MPCHCDPERAWECLLLSGGLSSASKPIIRDVYDPKNVRGQTLQHGDGLCRDGAIHGCIKCFEQSVPRGLTKEEARLAQEQIRRCKLLERAKQRRS